MTPDERIAQMELELKETRLAAIKLAVKLIDGYKTSPEAKERIARMLITLAGSAPNPSEAQVARLAAEALFHGLKHGK